MQLLRELIQIINKSKIRALQKIGFPFEVDNRLGHLYNLIDENQLDEEAMAMAVAKSSHRSGTYRRIRTDLTKRLINSLFLIDLSKASYNERQKAYYEVFKDWSASKILMAKNARTASVKLGEQVYRKASYFEFNEISLDVCRNLRLHYGTIARNKKKYDFYAEACKKYEQTVLHESRAEGFYAEIITKFIQRKGKEEELREAAKQYFEELYPIANEYSSYSLLLYMYLIRLTQLTVENNYELAIAACDDMITAFEAKNYTASVPLQIAHYQKLVCFLQLRRFDEQALPIEECLNLLEAGAFNWFKFQETYLLLALHTGKYDTAFSTLVQALQHPRFSKMPENMQEYWRVLEAYLQFLLESGKVKAPSGYSETSKFRRGKFLNDTPNFSNDKSGVNVSILIIQILFLVSRKKYLATIDKIESVEQYCRRHLYRSDTLRAFYFLKALLVLPKRSFHKEAVKRESEKYLKKMKACPLEQAGQSAEFIEIIPFEIIWELLLQNLQPAFARSVANR